MKDSLFTCSSGLLAKVFALHLKLRLWLATILLLIINLGSYGQTCPPVISVNYCAAGGVQLTSSFPANNHWNTGATTQSILVPTAGIYSLTNSGCVAPNNTATINVGNDLVVNGNFSAGNTGFNSQYNYTAGQITAQGLYNVTPGGTANLWNGTFYGYDHTVHNGVAPNNFLAANGADASNLIIWMQTVTVVPNTNYYFSAFEMDLMGNRNGVAHQVEARMNIVVPAFPVPVTTTSAFILPWGLQPDNANPWNQIAMVWNSGAYGGPIQLTITEPFIEFVGNNLGLDDISFSTLNPVQLIAPVLTSNSPVCPGNTINLSSSILTGTPPVSSGTAPINYSWTGPNGFTSTIPNPSIPNATAAMSGIYTLTVTDAYCTKSNTINVSVTSGITLNASAVPASICAGETVNITSSSSSSYLTTLLSADFNGATNTWAKSNTSIGGTTASAAWTLRPDGYNVNTTYHSNDNSQFYLSDSRTQNGTSTNTILQSPVMSTVGFTTLSLNFWQYYRYESSGELAKVEVSTNGTAWTTVATYNSTQGAPTAFVNPTINLNTYINNPVFYIRFNYSSTNHRARYWAIDNVTLSGTSNNYQISWSSLPAGFSSAAANPGNVTPLVNTTYTVTYTNLTTGCSESRALPVTVNPAPAITVQPQNVSTCVNPGTFSVTATGATTYQWYVSTTGPGGPWAILTNTSPYSGVTTSTLTINPIALESGFYYHCIVGSGTSCTTTSNPALLTVAGAAPGFTTQPANLSVCEGENALFTVVSNGQTFQWQENTGSGFVNITDGGKYTGALTADLSITGVTLAMNAWQYQCIATIPGCGTSTSNTATLTVNPIPVINTQPTSHTICPNTNTSFLVGATLSSGTIVYQWQENEGAGWVAVTDGGIYSGTQTSTLNLANVPDSYNGYQYQCIVSTLVSSSCSLISNPATLSLTLAPSISVQPPDTLKICEGDPATFSLTAVSSTTLTFQWEIWNGSTWSPIAGATTNPFTLLSTTGINNTNYRCIVTDNCSQSVISDTVTLSYKPKPITVPPANTTVCEAFGIYASFIVQPIPFVTYQWQVNKIDGNGWNNLNIDLWGAEVGVHASILQVWTPDFSKNGYLYRCVLTLDGCSETSGSAILTINPAPYYSYFPNVATLTYCAGSNVTLTANITGVNYSYLWYKDGVSTGITTQTITISAPGSYSAKVTNTTTLCDFTRVPVIVTETPASPAVGITITASPSSTVCAGTNVTFTAIPDNGGISPVYQWQKNGINVGGNFTTYNDIALANGDVITCILTANVVCAPNNPATSNAISMVVNPTTPVSISIAANPGTSIPCSTSVTFTATTVNEGSSPTYQWRKNGINVGTNNPTYTDAGLVTNDKITCVLTSSNPCAPGSPKTSNELTMTVTSPAVFTMKNNGITLTQNTSVCFTGPTYTLGLNNGTVGVTYWLRRDGIDISSFTKTSAPQVINFSPAQTAGGVYTVYAVVGGCSVQMQFSFTINIPPTITLGANPVLCSGAPLANLPYSATTGAPNQYSIVFTGAAPGAGFVNVTNATLPASPIPIVVPAAAPAAVYTANLTVYNSTTGCVSISYPITITVNNIEVDGTTPVTSACYPTLQAAFAAINTGIHQGAITVKVHRSTTETGTAILYASGVGSASYTSVFVYPTSTGLSISGNLSGVPLVYLNGADNVTINGNVGGSGLTPDLVISNTSTSSLSGTATIFLDTDATTNLITYCNVQGSSTTAVAANGGNIFIGDAAVATGNDNNTISYCNIGPAGSNLPTKGVYLSGSTGSTALNNSSCTITNNNIFDYFNASVSSAGIYIANGTTDCNLTNNRFYQTAARTQTTGTQHSAIWIANISGNNYTISGNIIGFANATGTGTYSIAGVSGTKVIPIYLNVGSTGTTNVQSNTIAGIAMTGSSYGDLNNTPFTGIYVNAGLVNIGGAAGNATGNIIGTATGSISFTTNSLSTSIINGIYGQSPNDWVTNNNIIGEITVSNNNGPILLTGIRGYSGIASWICSNNTIGSTNTNSIYNTSTHKRSWTDGIYNSDYSGTFTNNIIRNLTGAGGDSSTIFSVVGIGISASGVNHTVSQNTIYNLNNVKTTLPTDVYGIMFTGSTGPNTVERNFIYALTNPSTDIAATIIGIKANNGTTTYKNNIVSLNANSGGALIYGFYDGGGTNNIYHNTISLSGTSAYQDAAYFSSASNTRNILNNIFANARIGAGTHYAINITSSPTTIDFNDYVGINTGGGTNSVVVSPGFGNPSGVALTDYIPSATTLTGTGTLLITVPTDIDGTARCIPTMGAQENLIPPGAVTATASSNPICIGGTLTLTGISPGATSWSWTGPNGFTANTQIATIINITALGAGDYYLTATNCNGSVGPVKVLTIAIGDSQPPVALCKDITVYLGAGGTVTITGAMIDNGSTDNCGIASMTASPSTLNCSNVSPTPGFSDLIISEYVEGTSNNKYIELYNGTSSIINLTDYQIRFYANGASTPNNTDVLSGTLAAGATIVYRNSAAPIVAGATALPSIQFNGNDAVALYKISTDSYVDIFGVIGSDPGTAWTGAGGYSTSDKTLRRKATITTGITTNPTGTGVGAFTTLTTEWDLVNVDVTTGLGAHSVSGLGTPVTLTVTDASGNTATCTAKVIVLDNTPPAVACKNTTVSLDASGNATILPAMIDNGSSDNCGIVSTTVNPNTFSCANLLTPVPTDLFISEYVEGGSSNKYIEIYNGTGSSINLNNYQLRLYANGAVIGSPTQTVVLSGTLASGSTIVYKNSSASIFAGAATTNAAVNFNGNDAVVLWKISTNLPVDIFGNIGNDPGAAWTGAGGYTTMNRTLRRKPTVAAGVTVNPGGIGVGSFTTLTTQWDMYDQDNITGLGIHGISAGNITPVTLTLTDASGNVSTCTSTVTIQDNTAPTIVCPAAPATICSNTAYTNIGTGWNATATDNCGVASITYTLTGVTTGTGTTLNGVIFNPGVTTVTWSAKDVNNNTSTCQFTVNINPIPTATAPANQSFCNSVNTSAIPLTGTPSGVVFDITGGAAVGLANQTGVTAIPSFTPTTGGPVTITITPRANNCSGTPVTFTITVNPTPTAIAPANQSYCNNESTSAIPLTGTPSGVVFDITGGAAVGLANQTGVTAIPSFTPTTGGPVTITITPRANNCSGTPVTFTITVNPTPTAIAPANQSYCNNVSTSAIPLTGTPSGVVFDITGGSAVGLANQTGVTAIPSFTPTTGGPVTITITPRANNCSGTPVTFTITVNPLPIATASNNSPFCGTGNLILTGGPGGMSTYVWMGPNSFTSPLQSPSISGATPLNNGVYTLTVTDNKSCTGTVTTLVDITALPAVPTLTPVSVCAGTQPTFTASGGSLYEFTVGGVVQQAASTTNTFTPAAPLVAGQSVCVNSISPFNLDDGIIESKWGSPLATSAGGAVSSFGANNNIDALYMQSSSGYLYGAIAGNLVNNSGNKVLLFIDSKTGGYNNLASWTLRDQSPYYSVRNLDGNITFDPGFEPDYILGINQATGGEVYYDLYDMQANTCIHQKNSESTLLGFAGNAGFGDYTKGFEFSIPTSALSPTGGSIKVFAMIVNDPGSGDATFLSNQFLTRANLGETNYGKANGTPGNPAIFFGAAAPNPITIPLLSSSCSSQSCITVNPLPTTSAIYHQ